MVLEHEIKISIFLEIMIKLNALSLKIWVAGIKYNIENSKQIKTSNPKFQSETRTLCLTGKSKY